MCGCGRGPARGVTSSHWRCPRPTGTRCSRCRAASSSASCGAPMWPCRRAGKATTSTWTPPSTDCSRVADRRRSGATAARRISRAAARGRGCHKSIPRYGQSMPKRFHDYDRVAVVTGSDSGIGEAIAVALAKAGFDVGVTWNSDEPGARETAEKVRAAGRRSEVRQLDLTRLPQAAEVIDQLADALGGLGVLVNNSGTGTRTPAIETSYEQRREVLSVDLDGPFLCAQRAARRMRDAGRGGRIINITSVHEHVPRVGSAAYCAAKGGLGLLPKVMAQELAADGITVNAGLMVPQAGSHLQSDDWRNG